MLKEYAREERGMPFTLNWAGMGFAGLVVVESGARLELEGASQTPSRGNCASSCTKEAVVAFVAG